MTGSYIVQMQNIDGNWFDVLYGECVSLSAARRKAKARLKKNVVSENPRIRKLAVRIIRRVELVIE